MTDRSNSELEIDGDDLERYLDTLEDKKKTVSEASGSLRNEIKQILLSTGWNGKALAVVRQINDMSDSARGDFLRSFEPMFDVMVSRVWRDAMLDLFKDDTETEPAE